MGGPGAGREGVATPTHSGPCRAYGARSAGVAQRGRWAGSTPVYPPVIPTRYTHLVHTPLPARAVASGACAGSAARACTYGRFGDTVGEPRGVEHRPYSGSQTGYIQLFEIWEVCTAV